MGILAGPLDVPRRPVQDVLAFKAGEPCGYANCEGQLERTTFQGDDALVCDCCETPAIRVL